MTTDEKHRQYQWQYEQADLKFCPRCAHPFVLEDLHIKDQPQLVCDSCEFIFYLDPKLAVAAVVVNRRRVLLLQRAEEPGLGKWCLPGGHVERGKSVFKTIEEEVLEEASVRFRSKGILVAIDLPNQQGLQITFYGDGDDAALQTNAESSGARYFEVDDIEPATLAFEATGLALAAYRRLSVCQEDEV